MAQCRAMNYARAMHCGAVYCAPPPIFPVHLNIRNTPTEYCSSTRTMNAQTRILSKQAATQTRMES